MVLRKPQAVALSLLVLACAGVVIWQHEQNKRLAAENAALRAQAKQLAQARAGINRLTNQLKAAAAKPDPEHLELLRLRGEVGLLQGVRQENEQLKAQRDRLAQQVKKESEEQQANEEKQQAQEQAKQVAIAKMNFVRRRGLGLILFAQKHGGELPTNLAEAASYATATDAERATADQYGIQSDQYELMYHGPLKLSDIKNPANTILLRETQPQPAPSGTGWVRAYLFADGHSEIHFSPDGDFTAWESSRLPPQSGP